MSNDTAIYVRPSFENGELKGHDVQTGEDVTDKIRPIQLTLALKNKQYVRFIESTGKQRRFASDKIDGILAGKSGTDTETPSDSPESEPEMELVEA